MRIRIEDTAAIVVDYQEKLMPVMQNQNQVLHHASILLQGLKVLDIPMYITQQYTKGLGETVAPIIEATGDIPRIEKIRFSAYDNVKSYIENKKYIIVCGVEAHICVLQTVIDLANAGYTPVLVVDCISSRKVADMEMALKRAELEGGILTTYESILFELLEVAGNDKSKKIQRLIK